MNVAPENLGNSLLIAMSNTPDSLALIRVVATWVPGLAHKTITLMHYITPVYWEHGGGSSPKELETIRKEEEQIWENERNRVTLTRSYFEEARFILQDAGVHPDQIHTKIVYEGETIADTILGQLKEGYYSAVIIGSHHHATLFGLLKNNLADVIHRHAAYVHVWAIDLQHMPIPHDQMGPETPLHRLSDLGQSIWLDFINRDLLESGELWHMVKRDGLRGLTSNPAIFEKAIDETHAYDRSIRALAREDKSVREIYDTLTIRDVQHAADILRLLHDQSGSCDGFVSLEVSPHLAHDTEGTIAEARRLWEALYRPNVMIKVPATREGLPAIRQLISEGINVNVTLLFGLPRYREVAEAYIAGLEERAKRGGDLYHVASVASFFLSRIDVLVDPMVEQKVRDGHISRERAKRLQGQMAIASAKAAYQIYQEIYASERFQELEVHGAHTQRLLWASTSTKNPNYSDVKYVEALIGPDTVNTMPLETLDAYRDHGDPAPRLVNDAADAQVILGELQALGIDLPTVTKQLEDEGVEKFIKPFDHLIEQLEIKRAHVLSHIVPEQERSLGENEVAVQERIDLLEQQSVSKDIWRKNARLWKGDPENQAIIRDGLGWLHLAETMLNRAGELKQFATDVRAAGFWHVVHIGMGGSSLAPLVFQRTFSSASDGLPLTVLDTTDSETIAQIAQQIPLPQTLFIVASKSGTTAEPRAIADYFYARVKAIKGDQAGENFVAITDPGTPLVKLAEERKFRHTFLNFADIGGRYSALSYFGMVPAALMGIPVETLLRRAADMATLCAGSVSPQENPGLVLGAVLGELAKRGQDKVTFLVPSTLSAMGMWLEQLLAESTGKEGKGLLPVAGETPGTPAVYGEDRVFIYLKLKGADDSALEKQVAALRDAGRPVVTIHMNDLFDLGREFFGWEFATAVAGSVLGINPFDQPNVQESKDNTNRLLETVRKTGILPAEDPDLTEGALSLYASNAAANVAETLGQFFGQAQPGNYVAIMAYLTETPAITAALQAIRLRLRDTLHVATTVGYGPRFLHSTGQYHKGGPDTGLFLQLTSDEGERIAIPDEPYTFNVFKRAQAWGDLEALRKHGRRVIRVHLGQDVEQGLKELAEVVEGALKALQV
jgi:transaldolase/glucose-6-phosphate isomerase